MTHALVAAGVEVPTIKERIWRHVKDNPGCTIFQINSALTSIKPSSISSQLFMLENNDLVYVKMVDKRTRDGCRLVKSYYTDLTQWTPPAVWACSAKNGKTAAPKPGPVAQTQPVAHPVSQFDLDSLTIREAKALYQQLKEMFA